MTNLLLMKIKDLIDLYEQKRKVYGSDVYKHISELFDEAKKITTMTGLRILLR